MGGDVKRDELHVDVLCVGAGVASLATALRLLRRAAENPDAEPPTVLILEKSDRIGGHVLSGAVIDPAPFRDLLTPGEFAGLPVWSDVRSEQFAYLTSRAAWKLPLTPPPMRAMGYPIVSLGAVTAHLAACCEQAGAEIYTEMTVADYLEERGRVVGVRLGDKGVGKEGTRKANFEPGADVFANMVVLGEGAHGVVSQKLIRNRQLARDANEQAYALGMKELYELPASPRRAGSIMHSFGYPLTYGMYGGGFVYGLDETHVALGLVVALDYRHPEINLHELFRAYKAHPAINALLTAGKPVSYGAKILPEGGLFAMPRLVTDGALLVGDAAGLLDAVRLKGAHLAVESGLAAGDALYACWRQSDWSIALLQAYPEALRQSPGYRRWARFRNARQWFDHGLIPGMAAVGASWMTGGRLPPGRKAKRADALYQGPGRGRKPDLASLRRHVEKEHLLDIMSDLYLSGVEHDEDQPCHLVIADPEKCHSCIKLYNAPCTRFCPAQVYELPEGTEKITIQPSNCLHCKTCAIKCAGQTIEWRPPEAGGGPRYKEM